MVDVLGVEILEWRVHEFPVASCVWDLDIHARAFLEKPSHAGQGEMQIPNVLQDVTQNHDVERFNPLRNRGEASHMRFEAPIPGIRDTCRRGIDAREVDITKCSKGFQQPAICATDIEDAPGSFFRNRGNRSRGFSQALGIPGGLAPTGRRSGVLVFASVVIERS